MKIWSIKFTGFYPVGSAAIVCTYDRWNGEPTTAEHACDLFRAEWYKHYPSNHDLEPVTATLLDGSPGKVHILCDGNY